MEQQYAAAFEEWLRRFHADPDAYAKEYGTPESYGTGCAAYFVKLLAELERAA